MGEIKRVCVGHVHRISHMSEICQIHNRNLFSPQKYILGARYCSKSFIYINSFNPYNNLLRERFCRSTNLITEKLNSLPKIKQLVSERVSFESSGLAPKSKFLPTIYTASPFKKGR